MSLLTIGVNHTTAPLEVRERIAIPDSILPSALDTLIRVPSVAEAAIVSTCNRTEVYCHVESQQEASDDAMQWLNEFHSLEYNQATPYMYQYYEQNTAKHMFRVASGLDSMVLGEPEILGQLKQSYQKAVDAGTLGKHLNQLFQHSFKVAKKVRTHTSIGTNPVSVASTAVSLAKQIFGNLSKRSALFVGAGETIELAAQHLNATGIKRMTIANRDINRAQKLASKFNGFGVGLSYLSEVLPESDIVITATASTLPILGKGLLEKCIKQRRREPILIIDLAVPRDVEPEAENLPDIYLYSVDDLKQVIQENMQSRLNAAEEAEIIIDDEVTKFYQWMRGQDVTEVIRSYRSQAEQHKDETIEKAMRMLNQGKTPEEAIQFLGNTLLNKMLHTPTESLKSAGAENHQELLEAAKTILGIPRE
ncbi:MAG: glutamyl-tRNA reductase [Pseudomonadota bacterium]